ncbi:DUF4262 domain-containing protein [Nitriliruptor alkaliphilus]|uniref:DUF4262 domain-containing protein n=1 Tax=Nitriliruptor alkaliphilus TaxID=427918 RepID=UPI000698CB6B|nr:DUF4262 domain-containing protein [Nitriliruptor alkaliphilus]
MLDIPTTIARHGWAIQAVPDDGPGEPSFAYSIGLHERGLPELLAIGLHPEEAAWLVQQVAEVMTRAGGDTLAPGDTITLDLGPSSPEVRLGTVADQWVPRYLLRAYEHYGEDRDLDVLQILLPDSNGRYEGPDVDTYVLERQPLLSEVERPWRVPFGRPLLDAYPPPVQQPFLLLPIWTPEGPLGREELVAAEPLADGTWRVVSVPALADWCTYGTLVEADPVVDRCPLTGELAEVARYSRVVRESHWVAQRWTWHGTSEDDIDRLCDAVTGLTTGQRTRVCGPSAMPHAITVAAQPPETEPLRSAMRRLERDGIVAPRELFHRREEGGLGPHDPRCPDCAPRP